ncbi:hypothetical protein ACFQYP_41970 [Nonomuraea antimicrobica]
MLRTPLAVLTAGIVGASVLSLADPRPAVAASALTCSAVVPVYGIDGAGKLRWYGHRAGASGGAPGSPTAARRSATAGTRWPRCSPAATA